MRRFTSRGKRWVGPAIVLGLSSLLLAACSAEDNGQNSLKPEGPQAQKIDNLFIPVFFRLGRRRGARSRRGRRVRASLPVPTRQEREPQADPRQHPARDRLDDRSRAHPRRRRGPDDHHDLRSQQGADRRRRQRDRRSASSGGGSSSTPTQNIVTANELVIPAGRPVQGQPHGLRRVAAQQVQRDPQLLGPRAEREAGRRPGAEDVHDDRGRQARHVPRPVRRVLRAVAREHAVPGDREGTARLRPVDRRTAARARPFRSRSARAHRRSPPGPPRSS